VSQSTPLHIRNRRPGFESRLGIRLFRSHSNADLYQRSTYYALFVRWKGQRYWPKNIFLSNKIWKPSGICRFEKDRGWTYLHNLWLPKWLNWPSKLGKIGRRCFTQISALQKRQVWTWTQSYQTSEALRPHGREAEVRMYFGADDQTSKRWYWL
jgi:hypothetical protein